MQRTGRKSLVLIGVAVCAAVLAAYFVFDPADYKWMPKCFFHTLTGFECAGCGSQRAIHALLHGHFVEAFRSNALFIISLPVITLLGYSELRPAKVPRLFAGFHSPLFILSSGIVIVGWTVVRNLI